MGARHRIIDRHAVIALEAVPGVAEVLANADYDNRLRNIEITRNLAVESDSKFATNDDTEDVDITGTRSLTISFDVKLAFSGTANVAPKWGKLYQACGCSVNAYTTTGIGFQPNTSAGETTATIFVYDQEVGAAPDAVAYKCVGAMGNVVTHYDATGQPFMASFTFTGKEEAPTDIDNANLLELTSPDTTVAEKALSAPASIFGVSACISAFSLDAGNNIVGFECQSDDTGYDYFYIASRKPRLTIDPYTVATTTRDPYNLAVNETTGVITVSSASSNPNLTISIPVAQLITPGFASQSEAVKSAETYKCIRNDGTSISGLTDVQATWEVLHGARA